MKGRVFRFDCDSQQNYELHIAGKITKKDKAFLKRMYKDGFVVTIK